jgi:hypothetical protein
VFLVLGHVSGASAEELGPSYFRSILDKEGAAGVEQRLYVAPPDLMKPLFEGIAKGTAEWLDIYDRMRAGLPSEDATANYLDDALARALAVEPARLLSYFRGHPKIPAALICGLAPPTNGVDVFVLEPRELLELERREQRLSSLKALEVERQRVVCLDATRATLWRQLRIYFVSYGAKDAKSRGERPLNEAERRELEAAIAPARTDATLRAHADGSFPDGPFRAEQVPRGALDLCLEDHFEVANPEGPWEFSDMIRDDRPRARLLSACRPATNVWDITCQKGGFATQTRHVRARMEQASVFPAPPCPAVEPPSEGWRVTPPHPTTPPSATHTRTRTLGEAFMAVTTSKARTTAIYNEDRSDSAIRTASRSVHDSNS